MLNSMPRTPNFVRFKGQLESYDGVSGLVLTLIESGQNGIIALPKSELHLENGVFTFVAHPHLQGQEAVTDILSWQRGQFTFLGLPVCHLFSLSAVRLIFEHARQTDEAQHRQPPLIAVVNLPNWSAALTYAKHIAPLERWKFSAEGLRLAQPHCVLRIIEPTMAV
jgi:hypothetical protein